MNCPLCKRPMAECDADACLERIDAAGETLSRAVAKLADCDHARIEAYRVGLGAPVLWCRDCGAVREGAGAWNRPEATQQVKIAVDNYDDLVDPCPTAGNGDSGAKKLTLVKPRT